MYKYRICEILYNKKLMYIKQKKLKDKKVNSKSTVHAEHAITLSRLSWPGCSTL